MTEQNYGPYDRATREQLLRIARAAVTAAARGKKIEIETPDNDLLQQMGAAFVTLKKMGELRGCIGQIIARMPLFACVSAMGQAAAVSDHRFPPVTSSELNDIVIEVSVLTQPEPISPDDVVVGRDGLIASRGSFQGLLLPQVPEEWGWDREEFLSNTCRKAGLPMDSWRSGDVSFEAFQAIVFGESDFS